MKFKAIVCDLDGTLLNENHKISERTKKVIKKLKDKGMKIFIATGRHYLDAVVYKEQLGLDSYLITSNGAVIHDEKNKEIYRKELTQSMIDKLMNIERFDSTKRHIYTPNNWYVEEGREEYVIFHKESGFLYEIRDFSKIDENVIKFFFVEQNEKRLFELEDTVSKIIGKEGTVTLSSRECLEIMAPLVSKGEAIKYVMEKLSIDLSEVIGFGDGLNDFEMLSIVGDGVLMGNCLERLREKLPKNNVTKRNTEEGVAEYLENKFLTNRK